MDFTNIVYEVSDNIAKDLFISRAVKTQYLYRIHSGICISIEDSAETTLQDLWSEIKNKYLYVVVDEKPVSHNPAVAALRLDNKTEDQLDYLLTLFYNIIKSKVVFNYKLQCY